MHNVEIQRDFAQPLCKFAQLVMVNLYTIKLTSTLDSNWDNLRYFNALARHSTLSQAARELGVSHSTVQRHITAFENELEVQLFSHAASGYKLTPAGEVLYRETIAIRRTLRGLSNRISDTADAIEGDLSITTTDTIGHFIIPEALKKLQHLYPKIAFSVNVENRLSNIQELETDIAIRSGKKPGADLIGRQVGTIRFAVCASLDYMQVNSLSSDNAVASAPHVISLDQNFSGAHFNDWKPKSKIEQQPIYANGFMGAYQLCRAGLGITLLPAYILKYDKQLIELEYTKVPARNSLWVLSHADLRDVPRVKAVRKSLAEHLGAVFASFD